MMYQVKFSYADDDSETIMHLHTFQSEADARAYILGAKEVCENLGYAYDVCLNGKEV